MAGVKFEDCRCDRETDQAILVEGVKDYGVWIPKSQVHDDSEVYKEGTEGDLVVTEWIALEKGLI